MSKEHAYAYEAGYRDGSIHYELEHCPACKNVADLQEALDENARLRELVRDYDKMLEVSIIGYDEPDAPLFDAVRISLRSRMYKLGIEVSE